MGFPTEREELKEWCLRKLGKGAIRINVTDEQVEDRIDETIERFQEHHFDGVERIYLKRQVTASVLKFASPLGFELLRGTIITGDTSKAAGRVYTQSADHLSVEMVHVYSERFQPGETVTTPHGTGQVSSAADALVLGDKDNGWIPVDDSIVSVVQMMSTGGLLGQGLFSYTYQQALQYLPTFPTGGLNYFYMQKQHIALIEQMFVGQKILRYQRMQNRLYVDINWKDSIDVGEYMLFDAYKAVDPQSYKKVYRSWFVREYATALIEQQWGQNLVKVKDLQLPNGTTINGAEILDRAEKKLEVLEDRLRNELQAPPGFYVG